MHLAVPACMVNAMASSLAICKGRTVSCRCADVEVACKVLLRQAVRPFRLCIVVFFLSVLSRFPSFKGPSLFCLDINEGYPLLEKHPSHLFAIHLRRFLSVRLCGGSTDMSMRPKRPIKFRSLFKEEATEKDIQVGRLLCDDAPGRRRMMVVSRWICVKCRVPYRRSSCLEQTKRKRPV